MSSLDQKEDLDLLLSLQDRVLETPPASPSHSPGYLSDNEFQKEKGPVDMSVFRDAVQDCLNYDPINPNNLPKNSQGKSSNNEPEKFSGLRIRDQTVSRIELSNLFSDIRFVRLPAIKNMLRGDTLSGCWATAGILIEKGTRRTSSIGKSFAIWKMGSLDENNVSLFLFGDAYEKNSHEEIGTIFALLNCSIRKDKSGSGFSLSVFSNKHILKMGTSSDSGFCKGLDCKTVIDIRKGKYCKHHKQQTANRYTNTRNELKGGNLRASFRDNLKSEGIYVSNSSTFSKSKAQPVKLLSVEGLKKALSKADKVTTNVYSQGIRFLNQVAAGKEGPKETIKERKRDKQCQEPSAKKMKMMQTNAAPLQESNECFRQQSCCLWITF